MKGSTRFPIIATALLLGAWQSTVHGQTPGAQTAGHGMGQHLGTVEFPISCSAESQRQFHTGLALLHHMMYEQARAEFEAAAEQEPDCAMAHWGIAMTLFQPLWPTYPDEAALARGWALVQHAKALGPTAREAAYIAAAEEFYRGPNGREYRERILAWEQAMKRVHETFPDDREAAAFYALARLSTASATDKTLAHQKEAAAILEKALAEQPDHPGVIHYAIHAHDVPQMAASGVGAANAYDDIAPNVPHALHMPTHIYVRRGNWPEVIQWNRRSADAALAHPAGESVSHHYPHALDYLMYAFLQQGEDTKAKAVLDEIRARENLQPTFISAYAAAAIPARYAAERGMWGEAIELPERIPAQLTWDQFPGAEALTHFTRGVGAARNGDAAAAREAVAKLESLKATAEGAGDPYWAGQIEIQRQSVAAWLARAEGDDAEALRLMEAAADLEASTEKHPVTPGAVLPAKELLGELLLELNRPAEALDAFEATLADQPNRARSLFGAGRAAELAGDAQTARQRYSEFLALMRNAEGTRSEVRMAREFLNR